MYGFRLVHLSFNVITVRKLNALMTPLESMSKRKQNLLLRMVLKIISLAALSISEDRAIVGSPFDDDNGIDSGSAYIFEEDDRLLSCVCFREKIL